MTNETRSGGAGGGSVFLAFLGGAAVGVVAALFLAPRSGEETRAQIGEAVEGTREQVRRARLAAREAAAAARQAFNSTMQQEH
jgi:gas vesicle protein